MSVDVGTAVAYLDLDTTGFETGINKSKTWIETFANSSASLDTRVKALGNGFMSLGKTMSACVTLPLSLMGAGALKASIDFESAFTGVKKTVDGTPEQLNEIRESILDLSEATASSAVEISAVAEAAGQLGVATESVAKFSKIMIELGDSTNLSSEEAATSLARFMNIMKTSMDQVENLGSTIVDLGNNFATTEAEIVEMGTRLAASGKIVGLTETQVLALAASMSSVGIQAEAGATAMSQTLNAIEMAVSSGSENLSEFARIAGVTSNEFAMLWKDKPMEALQDFMFGLGNLETQGESATMVLDSLGLTGVRQSNMLKSLGSASELLAKSVDISSNAWKENVALTNEAEKRYNTTESMLKQLKASVTSLGIEFGDVMLPALRDIVDWVKNIVSWLKQLDDGTKRTIITIAMIAATIPPLLILLGKLLVSIVTIKAAMATISPVGTLIAGSIALIGTGVVALCGVIKNANKEFEKQFDSINKVNDKTKELIESTKQLSEETSNAAAEREKATADIYTQSDACYSLLEQLERLQSRTYLTTSEQIKQEEIVQQLNGAMDGLNLSIDENTGKLNMSTDAIKENIDVMKRQALMKAAQEDLEAIAKEQYEAEKKLVELRKQKEIQFQAMCDATKEYNEMLTIMEDKTIQVGDAEYVSMAQFGATKKVMVETTEQYGALRDQITLLEGEQEESSKKFEETSLYIARNSEVVKNTEESYNGLTLAVQDAGLNITNMSEESQKAINDLYTNTSETVSNQINLFKEFDGAMEESGEQMLKNMQSQVDGVTNWADNLQSLADRGINQGLLAQLAALGPEGASYVASFVDMTDAELEKANDAFVKSTTLSNEVALQIAESYKKAGMQTAEGFGEGIEAGAVSFDIQKKGQDLGNDVLNATKMSLQIQSPSRAMYELGQYTVEGLANGITENSQKPVLSLQSMLNQMLSLRETFINTGSTLFTDLWTGMQNVWVEMDSWLQGVVERISQSVQSMRDSMNEAASLASSSVNGSHANGLDYVPYNGYIAELHQGERVLTKQENKEYNNGNGKGGDTFIFNSPKPIDEYQAARLLRVTKKEMDSVF